MVLVSLSFHLGVVAIAEMAQAGADLASTMASGLAGEAVGQLVWSAYAIGFTSIRDLQRKSTP